MSDFFKDAEQFNAEGATVPFDIAKAAWISSVLTAVRAYRQSLW